MDRLAKTHPPIPTAEDIIQFGPITESLQHHGQQELTEMTISDHSLPILLPAAPHTSGEPTANPTNANDADTQKEPTAKQTTITEVDSQKEPAAKPTSVTDMHPQMESTTPPIDTEEVNDTSIIPAHKDQPTAVRHGLRDRNSIKIPERYINNVHVRYIMNLSVKTAINTYGKAAEDAIRNEFQQLISKRTWIPLKSRHDAIKSKHS